VSRNGEVTLTGVAQSEAEKALAGKLVAAIKGVTGVNNEMTVEEVVVQSRGNGCRPMRKRTVATEKNESEPEHDNRNTSLDCLGSYFDRRIDHLAHGGERRGSGQMKGSTRIAKGRIEESAGALVGNDKLRAKGQRDQAMGRVKQAATKAADKVAKAVGR